MDIYWIGDDRRIVHRDTISGDGLAVRDRCEELAAAHDPALGSGWYCARAAGLTDAGYDFIARAESRDTLPAELKARRLALGLTQRQLASAIEVAPNTVARWERGELAVDRLGMIRYILDQMQRDKAARGDDWLPYAERWIANQRS